MATPPTKSGKSEGVAWISRYDTSIATTPVKTRRPQILGLVNPQYWAALSTTPKASVGTGAPRLNLARVAAVTRAKSFSEVESLNKAGRALNLILYGPRPARIARHWCRTSGNLPVGAAEDSRDSQGDRARQEGV